MKKEIKSRERVLSEQIGIHDGGQYVLKSTALRAMKEYEKQLLKKQSNQKHF